MLDRTDFASWKQCIQLYCWGKENGVNILKSIDKGPFQMGTIRETLAERTEGAPSLGPERPRVYSDLSPEEKDRYNADIRAINILLQGLPKDIYTLIHHYTDANDIWDNVKMLLEGSQLTKEDWGIIHGVEVQLGIGEHKTELGMLIQVKQDRLSATTAMDLALNVDNVFQVADCDTFNFDVDEAPTAQNMFMVNLSYANLIYDEADPSYDSDIISEVHDHDHYQDAVCEHHEEHEMHDNYVKDNVVPGVQSNVSSVPNDAYMMIYNDMYEPHAQSVFKTSRNTVVDNSLTTELATYNEQVELYERRAMFELTEREQKINKQLRIVITDCNFKEDTLKKELQSIKLQLASTINHNKLMVEVVTSLKKDFKQKENKYLEDFLDMNSLKEKVEDRLFKQDQSL
nr:integrase, catalytic region, zinc finger, CCHC-type, peptidase aspartic, catalytic [Tanacetum cinerariifolium]